jgi:hypothetical protein
MYGLDTGSLVVDAVDLGVVPLGVDGLDVLGVLLAVVLGVLLGVDAFDFGLINFAEGL